MSSTLSTCRSFFRSVLLLLFLLTTPFITSCAIHSTEADKSTAAAPVEQLPHHLNAEEQYLLGMRYATGKEGEPDFSRARALFESSYAEGELRAAHSLGWLYFSGKGVQQDYRKAFLYFKDAAEHGNLPDAQHMLGVMYGNGWGVEKDTKQAWYWTKKAASQGQPEAMAILRALEERSLGTQKQ